MVLIWKIWIRKRYEGWYTLPHISNSYGNVFIVPVSYPLRLFVGKQDMWHSEFVFLIFICFCHWCIYILELYFFFVSWQFSIMCLFCFLLLIFAYLFLVKYCFYEVALIKSCSRKTQKLTNISGLKQMKILKQRYGYWENEFSKTLSIEIQWKNKNSTEKYGD